MKTSKLTKAQREELDNKLKTLKPNIPMPCSSSAGYQLYADLVVESNDSYDWDFFLDDGNLRPGEQRNIHVAWPLAADWRTCPVGQEVGYYDLPRRKDMSPVDDLLRELGIAFHEAIWNEDYSGARMVRNAIGVQAWKLWQLASRNN